MNYNPDTFFSIDVLKQVMAEFQWPAAYELEDVGAGTVLAKFPACTLVFSEGFESTMRAHFLNSETGRTDTQHSLSVLDAVGVIKPVMQQVPGFKEPDGLVEFLPDDPSLEKVTMGTRNLCLFIQTYLMACVEGDFSWVEEYNTYNPWDRPGNNG